MKTQWFFLLVTLAGSQAVGLAHDDARWPAFRSLSAAGTAEDQRLPTAWNGETKDRVLWKVPVDGLAHSSPIVWGHRIFLTSAVSSLPDASFKHGLYGSGESSEDRSVHRFEVYCLDRGTGQYLWKRIAIEGEPIDKRHIKATYANSTPATDGKVVVAYFGSQGLFAFDTEGNALWRKDLGRLDAGAYDLPDYEWGNASSPMIWRDLVFVQCDTQGEDFILACDLKTGETRWRTARDELPSWGSPNVFEAADQLELVTNGSNFIRAYDPRTGKELWRLGGSSQITAPTPVFGGDVMIVASGRRPVKPIFAIKPGGRGDITPPEGTASTEHIPWHSTGRGPYMPTPLIYDGRLYCLNNNGIFDCYDLNTGAEIYRERIPHPGGGFSASPVAADGKIYLSGEDGDIFVVKAGSSFELLATNPMGELLMATPAIAAGRLFVRGQRHLFAIGQ